MGQKDLRENKGSCNSLLRHLAIENPFCLSYNGKTPCERSNIQMLIKTILNPIRPPLASYFQRADMQLQQLPKSEGSTMD